MCQTQHFVCSLMQPRQAAPGRMLPWAPGKMAVEPSFAAFGWKVSAPWPCRSECLAHGVLKEVRWEVIL